MSVDVYIDARKSITPEGARLVDIINNCYDAGIDPPQAAIAKLSECIGAEWVKKALENYGRIPVESGQTVEFSLYGHPAVDGDVMRGGAIVDLSKLPDGTVALRVYAEA